ncbi:MAG TPA: caspase family protein [Bryobacteraceae bacterium]|nr:caspase family protein [Bryobacteraceae bacterium]
MRTIIALLLTTLACAQTSRDLKVERVSPTLPENRARWAVVVGVSSYKYAPPHAQLKFAHRDAEEFARFLRSAEGGGFPGANVRVLTEQSATVGGVRAAIHTWLPKSAGPNDVVYLFFAGHAVAAERGESYFVAHDSDPQNLHATGISFREVNDTLTTKLRAATVVLFADACHAGGIGWTSDPSVPSTAQTSLEGLGAKDRAFLKLLASRPSERSFEDERWGGGHGVFTYSVLTALRGAAERERDGFVRVSELIDYVSRVVPQQTDAKQNPRIAGNFEGGLAMASLPRNPQGPAITAATQADALLPAAAEASRVAALEDAGMECVSDYVQSTTNALKRPMFLRAVEAFTQLRALRPDDRSLEAKALFCQGRAQIAAGEFEPAVESLNRSLTIDKEFACSYNALGVALGRLNRAAEARAAFETAARLTPEWALPLMQIAQQFVTAGDLKSAVPYLEKAARLNPKAVGTLWSLARVHRTLGNSQDFARVANATLAVDRNYAPIYAEMGMFYESVRDFAKAAQAYDAYLTLAPNYIDSAEVRKRAQQVRTPARPPTLRRSN